MTQPWGTLYFWSSTTLCHTLKNWTLGRNSFPSISIQEALGHHSVDCEFEKKKKKTLHLQAMGKGAYYLVLAVLLTFKLTAQVRSRQDLAYKNGR